MWQRVALRRLRHADRRAALELRNAAAANRLPANYTTIVNRVPRPRPMDVQARFGSADLNHNLTVMHYRIDVTGHRANAPRCPLSLAPIAARGWSGEL